MITFNQHFSRLLYSNIKLLKTFLLSFINQNNEQSVWLRFISLQIDIQYFFRLIWRDCRFENSFTLTKLQIIKSFLRMHILVFLKTIEIKFSIHIEVFPAIY